MTSAYFYLERFRRHGSWRALYKLISLATKHILTSFRYTLVAVLAFSVDQNANDDLVETSVLQVKHIFICVNEKDSLRAQHCGKPLKFHHIRDYAQCVLDIG